MPPSPIALEGRRAGARVARGVRADAGEALGVAVRAPDRRALFFLLPGAFPAAGAASPGAPGCLLNGRVDVPRWTGHLPCVLGPLFCSAMDVPLKTGHPITTSGVLPCAPADTPNLSADVPFSAGHRQTLVVFVPFVAGRIQTSVACVP